MNAYIEKAIVTYCDTSQTLIARQIAYTALTNAGFTDADLEQVLNQGPESVPVMVFLA
ncbi:hypothetical protein PN836_015720 [Ningiella sp. W23]|uniref:hypothetical protein n=1 Tax=Ningiella sp. W23 TaxID=3023715 RepID=UPI003756D0A7